MLVFSNLVFLCGGFLLFCVFCGCVFVSRAFVEKKGKWKKCVPGTSSKKKKRLGEMCSNCVFEFS